MKKFIGKFTYGKNPELRRVIWCGSALEALFYDATHGVTTSHLLILEFFRNETLKKKDVPWQIQQYVAEYIGAALDGEIEPREILTTPGGRKPSTPLGPIITDAVFFSKGFGSSNKPLPNRSNRHGPGAFEVAGKGFLKQVMYSQDDQALEQANNFLKTHGKGNNIAGYMDIPEKQVERLYNLQQSREKRLREVNQILAFFYSAEYPDAIPDWDRNLARLKEIYVSPSKLR